MHRRFARIGIILGILLVVAGVPKAETVFVPKSGEYLCYKVYITGIAVGEQQMTAKAVQTVAGSPALLFEFSLDSYPSLRLLVDYHEKRAVLWSLQTLAPVREEATIMQKKETAREVYDFNPAASTVTVTSLSKKGETRLRTVPCEPATQTGASLLNYLRTFPWERGHRSLLLLGGKGTENYTFTVTEESSFKAPIGNFTQVYHLYNRELSYDIWFDRGPGHLPLQINSKLSFGVAQARLIEAQNYR